jgi:hypothetical protein
MPYNINIEVNKTIHIKLLEGLKMINKNEYEILNNKITNNEILIEGKFACGKVRQILSDMNSTKSWSRTVIGTQWSSWVVLTS